MWVGENVCSEGYGNVVCCDNVRICVECVCVCVVMM